MLIVLSSIRNKFINSRRCSIELLLTGNISLSFLLASAENCKSFWFVRILLVMNWKICITLLRWEKHNNRFHFLMQKPVKGNNSISCFITFHSRISFPNLLCCQVEQLFVCVKQNLSTKIANNETNPWMVYVRTATNWNLRTEKNS